MTGQPGVGESVVSRRCGEKIVGNEGRHGEIGTFVQVERV